MTLKEYIEKVRPDIVNNIYRGGVRGCPDTYDTVVSSMGRYCEITGKQITNELCKKCWNREIKEPVEAKENVEHPSHYNAHNIEVIDFIQDWELNFCLGNVIKYVCRSPYKGTQIEDLKKAREYLDFEIKRLEGEK